MKYRFKNTHAHQQQGKRAYQEDSWAQGPGYLLVADGVGGAARGDMASAMVAAAVETACQQLQARDLSITIWVAQLLEEIEQQLLAHALAQPESMGMASTLALLLCYEDRFYAIHVGDSRIYHFSPSAGLRWRSKDHSLVQELQDAGLINEEEAVVHPRSNVVTRVLQAKEGAKTTAAIHEISAPEPEDYFLVCSDGLNEAWTDEGLSILFTSQQPLEAILSELSERCIAQSRDNNTFLLAQVEAIPPDAAAASKMSSSVASTQPALQSSQRSGTSPSEPSAAILPPQKEKASSKVWLFPSFLFLLLTAFLGYWFWQGLQEQGISIEAEPPLSPPASEPATIYKPTRPAAVTDTSKPAPRPLPAGDSNRIPIEATEVLPPPDTTEPAPSLPTDSLQQQ